MENKLISVIITTHNRSELLERAVVSVQEQTYNNIEIIIVDDASDETDRMKNELLSNNEFILYHYISKEESKGGNYARNLGIDLSSGELIAFLDDDDVWTKTKIEEQVKLYNQFHFEVIGCGRKRIFVKDGVTQYSLIDIPKGKEGKDFSELIFMGPPFVTSELLISKNALLEVGKFDVTLKSWQEYDLLIRLSAKYIFGCVEKALVDYYVYLNGTDRLSNKLNIYIDSVSIVEEKYKERILSLSPEDKTKWKKLFLEECANRSFKKIDKRRYRWQVFITEKNIKNIVFFIFNINKSNIKFVRFMVYLRSKIFKR